MRLLPGGIFIAVVPPVTDEPDHRRIVDIAEFGEGGSLIGTARLGIADLDALDPSRPDLSETVGDIGLRYWLTGNTRPS